MLGKHVIFPVSSINYMFSVNYIIFLNITYVFAIITCLGFLVITSYTLYFNLTFFLCLNLSFVLTNYQPRQCNTSYNRAFIVVWSNDLETHHLWIQIASACGLVDSDFTNDKFLGHYPIQNQC